MKCPDCNGNGWTVEHSNTCSCILELGWYEEGCDRSGMQVPCEKCQATGQVDEAGVKSNNKGETK